VDDTSDSITNFERNVGTLSWPNLDNFARVICSTDCSNIYTKEVKKGHDVELGSAGGVGLLQMNLRSVEREGEL